MQTDILTCFHGCISQFRLQLAEWRLWLKHEIPAVADAFAHLEDEDGEFGRSEALAMLVEGQCIDDDELQLAQPAEQACRQK